ncbi:MAG: transcriptional regulator [Candidatus Marinimicrobia bacterium]|nr:transcriptional regulator [Candidatus Neomarinimicrobiota bacterium]|tara:strand:- start:1208 stop:1579 length:372 start_codon:yes stop_codon:yes gene_type:complete
MGKNNWTKKELKEFKDYILNKRKTVIDEMEDAKQRADEMLKNDTTNAIYSSHMADAGSDLVEMEKAYYFVQRDSKFLKYLNRALDMIDEGTFGICLSCKKVIDKERLMEVPHTTSCFSCKSSR